MGLLSEIFTKEKSNLHQSEFGGMLSLKTSSTESGLPFRSTPLEHEIQTGFLEILAGSFSAILQTIKKH
jgi:hypothetical protein